MHANKTAAGVRWAIGLTGLVVAVTVAAWRYGPARPVPYRLIDRIRAAAPDLPVEADSDLTYWAEHDDRARSILLAVFKDPNAELDTRIEAFYHLWEMKDDEAAGAAMMEIAEWMTSEPASVPMYSGLLPSVLIRTLASTLSDEQCIHVAQCVYSGNWRAAIRQEATRDVDRHLETEQSFNIYECAKARAVRLLESLPPIERHTPSPAEVDFLAAVEASDQQKVDVLLAENPVLAKATDENGRTGLHLACARGDAEMAKLLLSKGADARAKDNAGWTTAHFACKSEAAVRLLRILGEAYAFTDKQAEDWVRPLHVAVRAGQTEAVRLLLEWHADPQASDSNWRSPLHDAAESGNMEAVKLLLRRGAQPDLTTRNGRTAEALAAINGHEEIAELLAGVGDVYAFCRAAPRGDIDRMREMLKEKPELLTTPDQMGERALDWAVGADKVEVVKFLVERGVRPADYPDIMANAVRNAGQRMIGLLADEGAPVNAKTYRGMTALHFAAEKGRDVVALLVKKGADVNAREEVGMTPLQMAAFRGHAGFIRSLIKAGAKVDARDDNGNTALHDAAFRGSVEAIRALVEAGVDVNSANNFGQTPLHLAASIEMADAVQYLLANGAQVNATDKEGHTALDEATRLENDEVVAVLKKHLGHTGTR